MFLFLVVLWLFHCVFCDSCTPSQPYNSTYIPLQNCQTYYQMTIWLGQPEGQPNTFLVDTGSHTLWIPVTSCNCNSTYNQSKSTTYRPDWTPGQLKYADESRVSGYYGTQHASLPNTPIRVDGCRILFVTVSKTLYMSSQGIIGLGVSHDTIFDKAYEAKQIKSPNYILRLQSRDQPSGLYFNELPEDIVKRSKFAALSDTNIWVLDCLGFRAGSKDFSKYVSSKALIDSGTTLVIINRQLFNILLSQTTLSQCQYDSALSRHTCPLSVELPAFQIFCRGIILYLKPQHYTKREGQEQILLLSSGQRFILGGVLMKRYNVTFDKLNQKIGFDGEVGTLRIIGSQFFYIATIVAVAVFSVGIITIVVMTCIHNRRLKTP